MKQKKKRRWTPAFYWTLAELSPSLLQCNKRRITTQTGAIETALWVKYIHQMQENLTWMQQSLCRMMHFCSLYFRHTNCLFLIFSSINTRQVFMWINYKIIHKYKNTTLNSVCNATTLQKMYIYIYIIYIYFFKCTDVVECVYWIWAIFRFPQRHRANCFACLFYNFYATQVCFCWKPLKDNKHLWLTSLGLLQVKSIVQCHFMLWRTSVLQTPSDKVCLPISNACTIVIISAVILTAIKGCVVQNLL